MLNIGNYANFETTTLPTFDAVPGTTNREFKNILLGLTIRAGNTNPRNQDGGAIVREMQLLTVGFILAFLGAIVIGVF